MQVMTSMYGYDLNGATVRPEAKVQTNRYFLHINMADKRGKWPGEMGGKGRGGGREGKGEGGERGGREERGGERGGKRGEGREGREERGGKGGEGRGEARYAQSFDTLLIHWDHFHFSRS